MAKEAGQISDNGLEEPDLGKAFRWQDLEQAVLFVNIDYKLPDEIRPKKGQCVFLLRGYSDESGEHLGGSVVHKLDFPKQAFEKLNLSAYYREVGSSGSQIWLELPGQPAGTQVYAGYQYTQDQEGEIAITFASMNPMCDPYPPKIIRFQQG
jgi:hypothetical protein